MPLIPGIDKSTGVGRLVAYGGEPPLAGRSTAMVDIHDITERGSGPDNDGREYSNNKCLHTGNPRRVTMVVERLDGVDRVIPVGQYVRPRTNYYAT